MQFELSNGVYERKYKIIFRRYTANSQLAFYLTLLKPDCSSRSIDQTGTRKTYLTILDSYVEICLL